MKIDIGLTNTQIHEVTTILNKVLADEFVLYTKTRKYHWNVTGIHFNDLHKLFQAQYEQLEEIIDEVAERIRSIDGRPVGTLAEYTQLTRLTESPNDYPDAIKMIENLKNEYEIIIKELRKDIETCETKFNDVGTSDFLTGLMKQHEKTAWMLRSMLE